MFGSGSAARLDSPCLCYYRVKARRVEQSLMPYIYIIKSINFPKTYVGSTPRPLEVRLAEHNYGHCPYTKRHKPWELVYSEEFDSLADARAREKYFKTGAGRRFIKKNKIIRE